MIRTMVEEEEEEVVDRTVPTILLHIITVVVVRIMTIEVVVLHTTPRILHRLILITTGHMVVLVVEIRMVILHHLPVAIILHLHCHRHIIVAAVVNCMGIGTATTVGRTMIHTVVLATTITTVGLQDGMTVIGALVSVGIGAVARKGGWT